VRYAVLSDIHGNLEALEAVLRDAAAHADGVLCLGDIVGYGADPAACIELVAERAEAITGGNHERGVAGLLDLGWFNRSARAAAEWTRERLDDDHRAWLGALPLVAEIAGATLVHASPDHPEEWDYLVSAEDGFGALAAFVTRLCFVGHSHVPGAWSVGSSGPEFVPGAIETKGIPGFGKYVLVAGFVRVGGREVTVGYFNKVKYPDPYVDLNETAFSHELGHIILGGVLKNDDGTLIPWNEEVHHKVMKERGLP